MIDSNIESIVFTKIKTGVTKRLKTKYPDINFTTSNKITSSVKFPRIYIHLLESPEIGDTLEGSDLEALILSFLIEVYDSESQDRAKKVADEVLHEAKKLKFKMIGFPYSNNTDSQYRVTMRMRRAVCDQDKF